MTIFRKFFKKISCNVKDIKDIETVDNKFFVKISATNNNWNKEIIEILDTPLSQKKHIVADPFEVSTFTNDWNKLALETIVGMNSENGQQIV